MSNGGAATKGLLARIRQPGSGRSALSQKLRGASARTAGWVCYTRHELEWRFAKRRRGFLFSPLQSSLSRGTDLTMQALDHSMGRPPLFSARKRLFMASLLFAFLFPGLTWKQAAGCALLLLLFNTLILPRLDIDVSKRTPWPPRSTKEGESCIPAAQTCPAPTVNTRTGIILYPISVLALIALYRNHLHIAAAAWAIMALGDGMATVIGEAVSKWPCTLPGTGRRLGPASLASRLRERWARTFSPAGSLLKSLRTRP